MGIHYIHYRNIIHCLLNSKETTFGSSGSVRIFQVPENDNCYIEIVPKTTTQKLRTRKSLGTFVNLKSKKEKGSLKDLSHKIQSNGLKGERFDA